MKRAVFVAGLLLAALVQSNGQSRKELEELRSKNLKEIEYIDGILKSTTSQKNENLDELRVIGKKLNVREKLINEYGREIDLIEYRISLNRIAVDMLETDLERLKEEYRKSVISAYKATKGTPALAFVLSSSDINQGYKRLRYIQQITRYRRSQSEIIEEIYYEINNTKEKLEKDRGSVSDLRRREERQKQILKGEQDKKEKLVTNLSKKEKQLKQDLEKKKKITREIENEIAKLIEEERKKSSITPMSNEMKLIGNSFGENRGRLPWPVDNGIISSHFGLQPHPVLKNVTEDNIGIEITCNGNARAKSVFKGEVVRVFAISGANMAVIIRHGKYLTVYQNLINVKVKAGDAVSTGQLLGDVYQENDGSRKSVLKFMVYEEKEKRDPEQWIVKK